MKHPNFQKMISFIGRFLPLRHRYILTRRNTIRFRFVAPFAGIFAMGMLFVMGLGINALSVKISKIPTSGSAVIASADGAAGDLMKTLAVSQKRLQRYTKNKAAEEAADNRVQLASVIAPPAPEPREELVEIGSGDTMAAVLQNAGLSANEAYYAVEAMKDHYDPRQIRPGQKVHLKFDPVGEGQFKFAEMRMDIDALKSVELQRDEDDSFKSAIHEKDVETKVYAKGANIEVSLYGSAEKAGIPASVIAQAIYIYSWDVDFQRDIRQGDVVEIMYEQQETPEGIKVKSGDILYARLNVNGQDIPVYRYELENGDVDYYTKDGASVRKALMRTPIDGARISSGFGMRKHPVLGYSKMHKGVDFAAPRGTPIYAAGDGTIEKAGPYSSYGNYIRIRHNSDIKTAYAHLKGFAKGITAGKRVKQGQVIGYVGTTGRSTGPHLHYEVLRAGVQISPSSMKLQQGEVLKGDKLAAFKAHIKKIDRQYASTLGKMKFASR